MTTSASPRCWESFIIHLDILKIFSRDDVEGLRIFHYSPWYTYVPWALPHRPVENLSLFTLIYLGNRAGGNSHRWESFIIHLDILIPGVLVRVSLLRIFHYSPWYTYMGAPSNSQAVENLSLFTLIYLYSFTRGWQIRWESFIIHLDILNELHSDMVTTLRIFHYSPWYTYIGEVPGGASVENLSLFTLIYLASPVYPLRMRWESFIIHLDILSPLAHNVLTGLRIFHYSLWYTYRPQRHPWGNVENLSLFTLIYLSVTVLISGWSWESFIIHLDILIA